MPKLYESRKRILVTGGAGFIGSHLCDRLLTDGHEVVCADNLSTGTLLNIGHLTDNPGFAFLPHDIAEPLHVEVDEIYNLACPASPVHYQSDAVRTVKTAVLGAINVLDLAKRLRVPVLQASTSEVYGDPLVHPQTEDYRGNVNPIGPRACYDEGKRCAETLFFDYHRQHGVAIRIARIFNTYGPRLRHADGRVISNFIVQALGGAPLTIYGDGSQTRSFCFVSDMVEALVRLMALRDDSARPVNLGNPRECTMSELAQVILLETGSPSGVAHLPLPEDDPRQRQPDIRRAGAVLGWAPSIDLEEGIRETVGYFRRHPELDTG
ncbi:UDP-glucuronic acid decarboxylase family protein [Stappia sp.]|uniref:UDP-glucuronic acid decarboxylase family protein n=1 Tax=Stappia sp. TaxID=1870903 RepID=UPI003D12A6A8